jgi:hypothetical protein
MDASFIGYNGPWGGPVSFMLIRPPQASFARGDGELKFAAAR